MKTLIVEDDDQMRGMLEMFLRQRGHEVTACADAASALAACQGAAYPLVILDWMMPGGMDGLEVCRRIRQMPRGDLSVILAVTARNRPEDLAAVLDAGADDYAVKPIDLKLLEVRLAIAERRVRDLTSLFEANEKIGILEEQARTRSTFEGMIGKSAPMHEVFRRLRLAAETEVPVLILGQSGTGKELAAGAIHSLSGRKGKPFLAVNCAAFPETLLESELFGHVKGSFTGAVRDKVGIFQAANGGTLFLDEIGDLAPTLQVKLLRALEEKEIRRVGDDQAVKIDVRLVTATNRDLDRMIATGGMREDFYYRIHVFQIVLPPLSDRKGDVPLLVEKFLSDFAGTHKQAVKTIARDALQRLVDFPWPGNVRQLRNVVEQSCVLTEGDRITLANLPPDIRNPGATPAAKPKPDKPLTPEEQAARDRIVEALQKAGGSRSAAAKILGFSRVTLWKKIRKLGIE